MQPSTSYEGPLEVTCVLLIPEPVTLDNPWTTGVVGKGRALFDWATRGFLVEGAVCPIPVARFGAKDAGDATVTVSTWNFE